MNGEIIFWSLLVISLFSFNGVAIYLYRKKRIPLWISAVGMALLVPVLVIVFTYLLLNVVSMGPDDTGEGIAFGIGFLVVFLSINAVFVFLIGVVLSVYNYLKRRKEMTNAV